MAGHVTRAVFNATETVDAFTSLGVAADESVSAVAGVATFVALKPNRDYFLVGATSGKQIKINTADEGLGRGFLNQTIRELSVVFDAANVVAATGAAQNITAPAGSVDVGDTVLYIGRSGTETVACSVKPIVTKDVIPVLFQNASAADINPASQTFRFLVIKKRSNV